MGWEVMFTESHAGLRRWCFFCNTSDRPFGQVFYLNNCLDADDFYENWAEMDFGDPRRLDDDHLWCAVICLKKHFNEEFWEEYFEPYDTDPDEFQEKVMRYFV